MIRRLIFLPLVAFAFLLALVPACNDKEKTTKVVQSASIESAMQTSAPFVDTTAPDPAATAAPAVVEQPATTTKATEAVKEKTATLTSTTTAPAKAPVAQPVKPKAETVKPPTQEVVVKPPVKEPPPPPPPVEQPVVEKPAPVTKPAAEPKQDKWVVPAKAKATPNPIPSDKESLATGKTLYIKHCASCHGKSGAGDGTKAAQLKTPLESFRTAIFQSQTDGSLFYKILEGKDDMPSYKKKIPDRDEVWSIVNYLRTLK